MLLITLFFSSFVVVVDRCLILIWCTVFSVLELIAALCVCVCVLGRGIGEYVCECMCYFTSLKTIPASDDRCRLESIKRSRHQS